MDDDAADGAVERPGRGQPPGAAAAQTGKAPVEREILIRADVVADVVAGRRMTTPFSRGWQRPELVVIGLARRYR